MRTIRKISNAPRATRRRLRVQAGALYAASTLTVAQVHEHELFKGVPIRTLERWARANGWVQKRAAALQKAIETADARVLASVGRALDQQIAGLIELRDLALGKLRDESVRPRSWEGLATTFLEINKRLAELCEKTQQPKTGGVPGAAASPRASASKLAFTPEQLQELAKIYTAREREKLRARLRITNPEIYEDEVEPATASPTRVAEE